MKKTLLLLLLVFLANLFIINAQAPAFKVEVTGKGSPVLFFPGFACSGEIWKETTKELSARYECHTFTFAGFGGVAPITMPWLPEIKAQVMAYVNRLQLQQPVLVGHSLGGTFALWMAAGQTDRFKKVIVVDALPCSGALMVPNFKAADMVYDNPYSKQLLNMDSAAFRNMAKQQVSFMALTKDKHQQLVDWIVTSDRKTYVYGYVDMLKLDLREDIANIKIPVVILAATHPDKAMIEKTYRSQYEKLPTVQFHYADKAAHYVMLDQPEWFNTKLKENLQ